MTSLQTSTGTWTISWDAENRATRFENSASQTVVECSYDSQGRRFEKIVSVAGTPISRERFIYRGFLQIAAFDVAEDSAGTQILTQKRTTFWDPTEPTATRPLALQIAGTGIYFPCVDLTKNVCELVDFSGTLAGTYDYSPFGEVSASANVPANPFQWSSEFYDSELALVYYNYRHYSPNLGRWLSEDPIDIEGGLNLYIFLKNCSTFKIDTLGLWSATEESYEQSRREYVRERDETKQDLANIVQLDVQEFDKWAKPIGQIAQDGLACKYSVPNVWVAADLLQTSDNPWDSFVNTGGSIGIFIGTDLLTCGYKILKPTTAKELLNVVSSNKDNLWGLVVFAHGESSGKIFGDALWSNTTSQDNLRSKLPNYKLAKVYMMQCYSAAGGQDDIWKNKTNKFYGYIGMNVALIDTGSIVFPWNWSF